MMTKTLVQQEKSTAKVKDKNILISIILITQNHERELESIYRDYEEVFRGKYGNQYEIIFVDDGSVDRTEEILSKIKNNHPNIKVIKMRAHFGEASALNAGLKLAKGDIIVYSTNRVRIDPNGLLKLIQKVEGGYDFVLGWRSPRADSKWNQIISKGFNWIASWFTGLKLHDINSGVFVTKKDAVMAIDLYGDLNNFIPILIYRKGYKIAEEKIPQKAGVFRKSKYLSEYFKRILDVLTIVFLTKYSKKPLHFLGLFGIFFALLGGAIDLYLFFYRLFGMGPIAGRPLLLLGALLFILGVQMISIGLIGEMIIYTHASDIKEYSIEKIIE